MNSTRPPHRHLLLLLTVVLLVGVGCTKDAPNDSARTADTFDREVPSEIEIYSASKAPNNLHHALTRARRVAAPGDWTYGGWTYPSDMVAFLRTGSPDWRGIHGVSRGEEEISVLEVSGSEIVLAAQSDSGTCWLLRDRLYDTGRKITTFGVGSDGVPCDAAQFEVSSITYANFEEAAGGSPVPSSQR